MRERAKEKSLGDGSKCLMLHMKAKCCGSRERGGREVEEE